MPVDVTWTALRKPPTTGIQIGRFHVGDMAMIRATVLRALVLTAAFAAALTPSCLGEAAIGCRPRQQRNCRPRQQGSCRPSCSRCSGKEDAETFADPCAHFQGRGGARIWKQDTTGLSSSSRPFRSAGGRAILGRSCMKATVRPRRGSIHSYAPKLINPNSGFYLAINMGFPNSFRQSEPRRQLSHDPRRLLVERLLCHDQRTDKQYLFAGARLTPRRPAVIPGPGLSVPLDAGKSGAASK